MRGILLPFDHATTCSDLSRILLPQSFLFALLIGMLRELFTAGRKSVWIGTRCRASRYRGCQHSTAATQAWRRTHSQTFSRTAVRGLSTTTSQVSACPPQSIQPPCPGSCSRCEGLQSRRPFSSSSQAGKMPCRLQPVVAEVRKMLIM